MSTAKLTINLDALVTNWQNLNTMTNCETAAVVKANGYGLDAARVAKALAKVGARNFFVAAAEEGVALRRALGPGPGISVFSGHMEGDAKLLIESRQPSFSASGPASSTAEPMPDELNIASQVQLLQSVDLIKQVARDLKLNERTEFDPDSSPSAMTDFLVLFGLTSNPLELPPEERVINAFKEKLNVYQVDKSRVIGIEFTSKDPKLAAAVPNAMMDVYRLLQSGAKLDNNSDAVRWLDARKG